MWFCARSPRCERHLLVLPRDSAGTSASAAAALRLPQHVLSLNGNAPLALPLARCLARSPPLSSPPIAGCDLHARCSSHRRVIRRRNHLAHWTPLPLDAPPPRVLPGPLSAVPGLGHRRTRGGEQQKRWPCLLHPRGIRGAVPGMQRARRARGLGAPHRPTHLPPVAWHAILLRACFAHAHCVPIAAVRTVSVRLGVDTDRAPRSARRAMGVRR